jgi:hypothetical protein
MRTISVGVIVLTVLSVAPAVAAGGPPDTTCGYVNGRAWTDDNRTAKIWFLVGLLDGLARAEYSQYYFPGGSLNVGNVLAGVDSVYRDPVNVLIGVIDVVRIVKMRFEGAPQWAIDYALTEDRRKALACSEHQPKAVK